MANGTRAKVLQGTIITNQPGLFRPNEQEQALYLRSLAKVLPLPPTSIPRNVLDRLRSVKLPMFASKPKALDGDVQWGIPNEYVTPEDMSSVKFSSELISADHTCSDSGYLQIFIALRIILQVPPQKFDVRDLKIVVDAQRLNNLIPTGYPSEMDNLGLAFTSAENLKINGFSANGVAAGGNATWIMRNTDSNSVMPLPSSFIVFATLSPCMPQKDTVNPPVVLNGPKIPSLGKPFWKSIMTTNSSRSSIQIAPQRVHSRSQSQNSFATMSSSEASASSSKPSNSSAERLAMPPSRPISRASQFQVPINKLERQAFGGIGPIQLETSFTAGVRLTQTRYMAIIKPPPDAIGGSSSTFDCFDSALRPQLVWESRDAHEVLRSRITDMITDRDHFLIAQNVNAQLDALEQFLVSLHELQGFYRMHHEDEIQCGYQTSSARLVGRAVKAQMEWFVNFFGDKMEQLEQDKRFGAIIKAELEASHRNIDYYQ